MKEFKTIEQQLKILKDRNMIINDEDFVKIKLQENNY